MSAITIAEFLNMFLQDYDIYFMGISFARWKDTRGDVH